MSLPPKDVQPSALFAALTATPRPHKVVDLPRKGPDGQPVGRVAMVPLTQEEAITAAAEAERRARKLLGDSMPKRDDAQLGYEDVYNNVAACEILHRACREPDDLSKCAFRTPHEIGKAFSNDEIAVMHHDYLTVKLEVGPIVAEMTPAELETWITLLAEGGTAIPLDKLSWGALTTLVLSMASRLYASRTDNSSPGGPPDASSPAGETQSSA